ncbi:MAG TPA: cupin domain-containing protein [Methylomirabilota bacterium]|nr:cupin domain-containing protein [Methylomirabilota bacterium]
MTKDAPTGRALRLADHVAYHDDAVVSKTLLDKKAGTLTLFAFDAGQHLSEHTSPYDAVVHVLDGQVVLVIGGEEVPTAAGELTIMPANVPHAVRAEQRCKMLLTMIR